MIGKLHCNALELYLALDEWRIGHQWNDPNISS